MTMNSYYIYMMSNLNNNVLYIGVTNDLIRRVYEHKNNLIDGFTKTYNCHKLVWFQQTDDITTAIAMEKRMKKWKREFKENLIREMNPDWIDLYSGLM
jgi:putative endonuclease